MAESKSPMQWFAPLFDAERLAEAQQRNLAAFSALGACLSAGAERLLRRQGEMVRLHIDEQLAAAGDILAAPSPSLAIERQLSLAQSQTSKAVAQSEELAGMAGAIATEAFDIFSCRIGSLVSGVAAEREPPAPLPTSNRNDAPLPRGRALDRAASAA